MSVWTGRNRVTAHRLFMAALLLCACVLLLPACMLNHPTALDADEGYAVYAHVQRKVELPDHAAIGRTQTRSLRIVRVTGVEDPVLQAEILDAAIEAWRYRSSKPVVVKFYRGTVKRLPNGGVVYPDGRELIRRVEIP